ncbi:MAG: sulfite exporter TauE/SafE family protein [Candidatus Heimdallarchaeota archaeon]|nr:sulfite exporter TauE/SafE family protein [Candidatus Heimdallarchaeota archaeon]
MTPEFLLILFSIAIITGVVVGMSGGSAVVIVVPLLSILLDFSIYTAIGVSLLVDVLVSVPTSLTYYRHGNVDFRDGRWMTIGAVLGAIPTSLLAISLPEQGIGSFFGIMLLLMAWGTWKRGVRNSVQQEKSKLFDKIRDSRYRQIFAFGLGMYAGISAGLMGAGGGGTFFVFLVFVFDYPLHKAVGTSTLIMIITAVSASTGYILSAHYDIFVILFISLIAIIAGILTARYANSINEEKIGKLIAIIFVIIGISMFVLNIVQM